MSPSAMRGLVHASFLTSYSLREIIASPRRQRMVGGGGSSLQAPPPHREGDLSARGLGVGPREDLRNVRFAPGLPGTRHLPALELDADLRDTALVDLEGCGHLLRDVDRAAVERLLEHG